MSRKYKATSVREIKKYYDLIKTAEVDSGHLKELCKIDERMCELKKDFPVVEIDLEKLSYLPAGVIIDETNKIIEKISITPAELEISGVCDWEDEVCIIDKQKISSLSKQVQEIVQQVNLIEQLDERIIWTREKIKKNQQALETVQYIENIFPEISQFVIDNARFDGLSEAIRSREHVIHSIESLKQDLEDGTNEIAQIGATLSEMELREQQYQANELLPLEERIVRGDEKLKRANAQYSDELRERNRQNLQIATEIGFASQDSEENRGRRERVRRQLFDTLGVSRDEKERLAKELQGLDDEYREIQEKIAGMNETARKSQEKLSKHADLLFKAQKRYRKLKEIFKNKNKDLETMRADREKLARQLDPEWRLSLAAKIIKKKEVQLPRLYDLVKNNDRKIAFFKDWEFKYAPVSEESTGGIWMLKETTTEDLDQISSRITDFKLEVQEQALPVAFSQLEKLNKKKKEIEEVIRIREDTNE